MPAVVEEGKTLAPLLLLLLRSADAQQDALGAAALCRSAALPPPLELSTAVKSSRATLCMSRALPWRRAAAGPNHLWGGRGARERSQSERGGRDEGGADP